MELGVVNFYYMKQQRGKCMKSFLKTTRKIKLCVSGRTECMELQIQQYEPSWIFQQ